jgi:hypothetical protein
MNCLREELELYRCFCEFLAKTREMSNENLLLIFVDRESIRGE